jgi:hypothetical protein
MRNVGHEDGRVPPVEIAMRLFDTGLLQAEGAARACARS